MKKNCTWKMEDVNGDVYDTDCGNCFQFNDGSPEENKFKFCPYCGRHVKEKTE